MTDVVFHDDVIEKEDYGLPEAPLSTPDENFNRPNSAQPSPRSYAAAANPAPQTAHDQPPALPVNNADNELPIKAQRSFNKHHRGIQDFSISIVQCTHAVFHIM